MPRAAPAGAHPARGSIFVAGGVGRTQEKMAHFQNAAPDRGVWRTAGAGGNLLPEWGRPELETVSFSVMWRITVWLEHEGVRKVCRWKLWYVRHCEY